MIGTIRFNLRRDKIRKTGKCPVEVIYSVKGQRQYINTGINLFLDNWSMESQSVVYFKSKDASMPTVRDVQDINLALSHFSSEIDRIEKKLLANGEMISSSIIKEHFTKDRKKIAKKEEPSKFLYDFIDRYIEENQSSRVKGSLGVYKSLKKHLQEFEAERKHKTSFENINYAFFQAFQSFLLSKRIFVAGGFKLLQNTTIAKQLSTLKTFLSYAQKYGINIDQSYRNFVIKREKLGVIALTETEFLSLYNIDLDSDSKVIAVSDAGDASISYKTLAKVRDIFCFSCATGLRYSDLMSLQWENVKGDELRITVTKTKDTLTIPLNGYSSSILQRYKDKIRPLPTISSQKFNIYVKELCKLAGIDDPTQINRFTGGTRQTYVYPKYELISAHVGRKTFCTLSLEKGMSAEQVMKISGHNDYKSFQRYVQVTETIKRKAMFSAWGEPANVIVNLKKVD